MNYVTNSNNKIYFKILNEHFRLSHEKCRKLFQTLLWRNRNIRRTLKASLMELNKMKDGFSFVLKLTEIYFFTTFTFFTNQC